MTTLRDIRKRIQSVQHVEQITKAMEMVAVARLHRAQVKAEQANAYAAKLKEILDKLAYAFKDSHHPFFNKHIVRKTGLVIMASDKGLCGSYNTNVFSAANSFLKKYDPGSIELILIGQKAINHFQNKRWPIKHKQSDWLGKNSFADTKAFMFQLTQWFLDSEFDEIWLVYTKFVSILKRDVVVEKFLNMEKQVPAEKTYEYIFEPDQASIFEALLPRYALSQIQAMMAESFASEQASRAFSMRKATNNAKEMIQELTLIRNKVRQTGITREIIEIASGAEGCK